MGRVKKTSKRDGWEEGKRERRGQTYENLDGTGSMRLDRPISTVNCYIIYLLRVFLPDACSLSISLSPFPSFSRGSLFDTCRGERSIKLCLRQRLSKS